MTRSPSKKFLEQAQELTKRESEFLLMRMHGKLGRRIDDHKITPLEALAVQLEIEEEHRKEWRKNFAEVKARFDQL